MQRIGQRVVDDVDLGVVDHVVVGADDPFDAVLVGENLGPLRIARRDGDQSVTQLAAGPTMASSAIRDAPSTPIRRLMPAAAARRTTSL